MSLKIYDWGEVSFKDPSTMAKNADGSLDWETGTIYQGTALNFYLDEDLGKEVWTLGNGSGVTITGTLENGDGNYTNGSILPFIKAVFFGDAEADLPDAGKGIGPLFGSIYISSTLDPIKGMRVDQADWQDL